MTVIRDTIIPDIDITSPSAGATINSNSVTFTGSVSDANGISSFFCQGEYGNFVFIELDNIYNDNWSFTLNNRKR